MWCYIPRELWQVSKGTRISIDDLAIIGRVIQQGKPSRGIFHSGYKKNIGLIAYVGPFRVVVLNLALQGHCRHEILSQN